MPPAPLTTLKIYRNEQMTRAATIVLLDQSRSMGMFNNWVAAKRVTLALFALIRQQYPRDTLHVVGFSDYARELPEEDLAGLTWNNWVSGTNLHHALMLARRLLSREKGGSRQIMVITDGEPTAHLEGQQAYFSYPPSHRTEVETFKEVRRCTQEGIVINTFMLENNYQLVNFVDRMTRINRGRAFYSSSENLGGVCAGWTTLPTAASAYPARAARGQVAIRTTGRRLFSSFRLRTAGTTGM